MGTGSVEIRGDTMRISFYYEGKRCRPMLKIGEEPMRPTKANLKYAADLVKEVKAKIKAGEFVMAEYFPEEGEAGPTTVGKQLDTWLNAQRVEKSTLKGYQSAVRFWKKASYHDADTTLRFEEVPIRQVKHSHILTALARRETLSGKTINNYVSVLRSALGLAELDKIIHDNPATAVPSAKWQRDPPDPFSAEERDKIIAYADKAYPGQVANMVRFWMWSGLRTSELLGLKWANVDLASGAIVIKETRVAQLQKKRTKTHVARTVRLPSPAQEALKAQKEHTYMKGEEVFQDPRHLKAWLTEASFRKVYWSRIIKVLGIRYRRPYQCRHTYATVLLMNGRTPAWCAKQLGHGVDVFLKTYSKWLEGDADDREMAALESSISPRIGPKATSGGS